MQASTQHEIFVHVDDQVMTFISGTKKSTELTESSLLGFQIMVREVFVCKLCFIDFYICFT